ncbi:MAG: hypothetical protein JWN48_5393 [Myxococcaceae bacterium]|nr:hypothetical protein [Myxococcaceae bacterium]
MIQHRITNALRQVHPVDWLFLALALVFGAVSLAYPFGRDQGLYHYVGREWFLGALPYRDVMDQKTPIIYLIFGLANFIFGEHMWSVRLVELVWVLTAGWMLGVAATPRGERSAPGTRGAGSLFVCLLYFGVLGFWDTAQCEIWYMGLSFLSLGFVERSERPMSGPVMAGVFGGLACLTKPPAVFVVLVVVFALVTKLLPRSAGAGDEALGPRIKRCAIGLGLFGVGALLPTLITLAYFWARGGIADLYDVVVLCNKYYREHELPRLDFGTTVDNVKVQWAFTYPLSLFSQLAASIGLALSVYLRSFALARRYLIALFFPIAGATAVVVQGLFFNYHYAVLHVGWSVALVFGAQDLARLGPGWLYKEVSGAWFSGAVGLLVMIGYTTASNGNWYNHSTAHLRSGKVALDYQRGLIDEQTFNNHWNIPNFYDWSANVAIGKWLEEHTKPEDRVASRNFEPAIYAISHRTSDLRFFWTPWIVFQNRSYRREEWRAQDLAQVKEHPPRFVVVFPDVRQGPDSIEYFWPIGTWAERMRYGNLVVFERISDQPTVL